MDGKTQGLMLQVGTKVKEDDGCHVTHRKFLIIISCCCYFKKIVNMLIVLLLHVGPQFLLLPNTQNHPSLLTLVRAVEGRHGMECEANSKTPTSKCHYSHHLSEK